MSNDLIKCPACNEEVTKNKFCKFCGAELPLDKTEGDSEAGLIENEDKKNEIEDKIDEETNESFTQSVKAEEKVEDEKVMETSENTDENIDSGNVEIENTESGDIKSVNSDVPGKTEEKITESEEIKAPAESQTEKSHNDNEKPKKKKKKGFKFRHFLLILIILLITVPLLYLNFAQIDKGEKAEDVPSISEYLNSKPEEMSTGSIKLPYEILEKTILDNVETEGDIKVDDIMIDGKNSDIILNVSGKIYGFIPIKTSLIYDFKTENKDNNLDNKLSNLRLGMLKIPVGFLENMIDVSKFETASIELPEIYTLKKIDFADESVELDFEYDESVINSIFDELDKNIDGEFIGELLKNMEKLEASDDLKEVYDSLNKLVDVKDNKDSGKLLELLNGEINYFVFIKDTKRESFYNFLKDKSIKPVHNLEDASKYREKIEKKMEEQYEVKQREIIEKFSKEQIKDLYKELLSLKNEDEGKILIGGEIFNLLERKLYSFDDYIKELEKAPKENISFEIVKKNDKDFIYVKSDELGNVVFDSDLKYKEFDNEKEVKKSYTFPEKKSSSDNIKELNLGNPIFSEVYTALKENVKRPIFIRYMAVDDKYAYIEYYDSQNLQELKFALYGKKDTWKILFDVYEANITTAMRGKDFAKELQNSFNPNILIYKDEKYNNLNLSDLNIKKITASSYLTEREGTLYNYNVPQNLTDGNINTYWAEGSPGLGEGESITVEFENEVELKGLDIYNGCSKSKELLSEYSSVKSIEIIFAEGKSQTFELTRQYETVNSLKFSEPVKTKAITLKVLEAYKGTKFEDTCLGEIMFRR